MQPKYSLPPTLFLAASLATYTPEGNGVFLIRNDGVSRVANYCKIESDLKARFELLSAQWKDETWFMSNAANVAKHPAYQEIIRIGVAVLPFIFESMQLDADHWFWALNEITQVNPVELEHAGDIDAMTTDWLKWGKAHNYI